MRSSFRDWNAERGVRREVAEAGLAHVVKNKVDAAYGRSDLLESRREVMERWSGYLQGNRESAIDPRKTVIGDDSGTNPGGPLRAPSRSTQ